MKHLAFSVLLLVTSLGTAASGQDATRSKELRSYSTPHSIGIEWDITDDANHDATCQVQYRVKGTTRWKQALPLFRVDFYGWYANTKADQHYNMLAGSILFLEQGTAYEVKLDLFDPDGGAENKSLFIQTRAVPHLPKAGRTFHVVPGAGRGDGSINNPFQGLNAAQAVAKPGDIFQLHRGNYGNVAFNVSGAKDHYIAWKAAEDEKVVFNAVEIASSHIWLEGVAFKKADRDPALKAVGAPVDVVVLRNTFTGFHDSMVLSPGSQDWFIADNVVVGDNHPTTGGAEGEGIDLNQSSGHVVAYNRISRVQAGVHYPKRNCDIYGNDIFDCSDDGLEPDYGYANIRMWGNRIYNIHNNAISFQPMYCGPWYFIRNQVITSGAIFKFRVQADFC